MFCKNCGSPIDPNSPFCPNCGCPNTPDLADNSTTNDIPDQNSCTPDQNNYNDHPQDQNNYNGYPQNQNNYNGYPQDQNNYNGHPQDQNNYNGHPQDQNNYNGYPQDQTPDHAGSFQSGYSSYSQNTSAYNGPAPDQNFSSIDPAAAGKKKKKRSPKTPSDNGGKKSKLPFIIGGCVLAAVLVIVIIGVACADSLTHFYYKTFASEQSYQNYVLKKHLDDSLDTFVNNYDVALAKSQKAQDKGIHGEITMDFEPAMSDFFSGITDTDMDWLTSVSFDYDQIYNEEMTSLKASTSLNETPVLSLDLTGDMDVRELYGIIPELSDKYIGFSFDDLDSEISNSPISDYYPALIELSKSLPEGKEFKKILPAYYDTMLDCIKDVKKEKETLVIDKLSENCIKLTTHISDKDFYNIAMTCIKQAKNDKELKKVLIDLLGGLPFEIDESPEKLYENFLDSLDNAASFLEGEKDYLSGENMLDIEVWVTSSGDIAGICLSESSSGHIFLESYSLKNKKESETFISVIESVYLTGSETIKKGKADGTYVISYYDTDILNLTVKDFDEDDFKKGYMNGSYTLKPDSSLFTNVLDAGPAAAFLAPLNIRIDCNNDKDSSNLGLSLLNGSDSMISINMAKMIGTDEKFSFPPEDAEILNGLSDDDLQEYLEDCDTSSIMDSLEKAGVPSEFLDAAQDPDYFLE